MRALIRWFWLLSILLVVGCSGASDEPQLEAGTYRVVVENEGVRQVFEDTGRVSTNNNGDWAVSFDLPGSTGMIDMAFPVEPAVGSYILCPIDIYNVGQCGSDSIAISYQQEVDGSLAAPAEFANGTILIDSVAPLTGSFSFLPIFENGESPQIEGAFNELPTP